MDEQQDSNQQSSPDVPQNMTGATYQPGQVVQPPAEPVAQSPAPMPTPVQMPVQAPVAQAMPVAPMPQPQPYPMPAPAPTPAVQVQSVVIDEDAVSWEASEHVDYNNDIGWILLMALGGSVLIAGIYFIVDWMSALVVALLLGGLLFYSKIKPRNVRYVVSDEGISVGERDYAYSEFRSFSFNQDGAISSIFLVPMQRFMIPITMYVAPENQDQIAGVLAQHLPNKQRKPDFMDRITSKLRF